MQEKELKIGNWRIPLQCPPLGYGMGAVTVRTAYDCNSRTTVAAAKIIPKAQLAEQERTAVLHEVEVLRRFDHPHIMKLLDFREDEKHYILFLERCDGTFTGMCDNRM
jgi:serine/threonine protein kinase